MQNLEKELMDLSVANQRQLVQANSSANSAKEWDSENKNNDQQIDANWAETFSNDLPEPHIEATLELAESVCGRDDRKRVVSTAYPNRFICRLLITAKNGSRYIGSGFFISPKCIITSGHCVHFSIDGNMTYDWAKTIQVIPGANGGTAPFGSQFSSNFRTVKGWAVNRSSNHDHGAIILPDDTLYRRVGGFFGCTELKNNRTLINTGYPGDKKGGERGTPWSAHGPVSYNNEYKIAYMLDTYGGNSGSPVFIAENGKAKVVGVHGYGHCPNKCVKVNSRVLQRWNEWRQL